jgi:hypothetical protein
MNYLRYSCSHGNTKKLTFILKINFICRNFCLIFFSNFVLWNKMNNNEIVDMLQAYFGNNRNYYLQRNATWKPSECHVKCREQNGAQFEQSSWKKIVIFIVCTYYLINIVSIHGLLRIKFYECFQFVCRS